MPNINLDHGYTFFELDESARTRAIRTIQKTHHLTGDIADPDQLTAAMATALATAFGQPCTHRLDLEVTVWDEHRCPRFSLAGTLYPTIATALPWTKGIQAVTLQWHRRIQVHTAGRSAAAHAQRMHTAAQAAIAGAWQAAHRQVDRWQALEWVLWHHPRFTAAGALTSEHRAAAAH